MEQWKRVLWSDESPFELFPPTNRQNDRVWAKSSGNIEPVVRKKFPGRVMVWGMMSHSVLSELHIIPQGKTVNPAYYCDNILAKTCKDALSRKKTTGTTLLRAMTSNMSEIIFIQDGAPAHTAKSTQKLCAEIFPSF